MGSLANDYKRKMILIGISSVDVKQPLRESVPWFLGRMLVKDKFSFDANFIALSRISSISLMNS